MSDDATEAPSSDRLPKQVWILSAVGFLISLGFGLLSPALPALADLFSVSAAAMSLTISGFAAFRLATTLLVGGQMKRWRLRTVLATGLIIQAVTSVIGGLAQDGTTFLLFRALGGIGSAFLVTSSMAMLLALVSDRQRGKATSMYFAASALGQVSGPGIGGLIAVIEPRLPMLVYGLLLFGAASVTWFALRASRSVRTPDAAFVKGEGPSAWGIATALLRNPLFIASMLCQFAAGWVNYGVRSTALPLHLGDIGFATGIIGLLMTVAAILQVASSGTAGTLSDRVGRLPILLVGLGGLAVSFALFAISPEPWVVVLAFVVLGITGGAFATVPPAMLGDVPLGGSGPGVALFWVFFDVAAILGPTLSGLAIDQGGYEWAFLLCLAPIGLAMIMAIVALRPRRSGAAPA